MNDNSAEDAMAEHFLKACRERPTDVIRGIKAAYRGRSLPLEARIIIATLERRIGKPGFFAVN